MAQLLAVTRSERKIARVFSGRADRASKLRAIDAEEIRAEIETAILERFQAADITSEWSAT